MCGRFTITLEPAFWQEEFELENVPGEWKPRYNVAPTQEVPVVASAQERQVQMMRWGLIPFWAKDKKIGYKLINARSETIEQKPSFKYAFSQRRCLIIADGFYEWQRPSRTGAPKVPYYFKLKNEKPFTFAGIWERWKDGQENEVLSCSIITCAPNSLVEPIHNRMPVVLDSSQCWAWLAEGETAALKALLKPHPAHAMQAYAVGRWINNPKVDKAECTLPLAY